MEFYGPRMLAQPLKRHPSASTRNILDAARVLPKLNIKTKIDIEVTYEPANRKNKKVIHWSTIFTSFSKKKHPTGAEIDANDPEGQEGIAEEGDAGENIAMEGGDITMSGGLGDGEVVAEDFQVIEDAQLAQGDALTKGNGIPEATGEVEDTGLTEGVDRRSFGTLEQETAEQYAVRMQKEAVARVNARLSMRPHNRRSWQLEHNSQGQLVRTDNSNEDKGTWVAPASWNIIS